MKKILITLAALMLVIGITIPMAIPVAAASPPQSPQSWMSGGDITHTENIGGKQITICGELTSGTTQFADLSVPATGTFIGHTVFPNDKATEDSWFELTEFTGWIVFTEPTNPLIIIAIPGVNAFHFDFTGRIKVNIHNGTQPNQPVITIRSSEPIPLSLPGIIPAGMYKTIQLMGWQIVHAS